MYHIHTYIYDYKNNVPDAYTNTQFNYISNLCIMSIKAFEFTLGPYPEHTNQKQFIKGYFPNFSYRERLRDLLIQLSQCKPS